MAQATLRTSRFVLMAVLALCAARPAAAQVDLSLSSTLAPPAVEVAGTTVFTVTITNPSDAHVNNARKAVVLPVGVTYVSSSAGSYTAATRTWSETSRVKKNESNSFTLTLTGSAVGVYALTADITAAGESDPNAANNTTQKTLTVSAPPPPGTPLCYVVADAGGANGGDDWLIRLNRDGSAQRTIGTGTGTNTLEAIAYWPGTHTLYAANAGTLGTLSFLGDGTYTRVGTVGFGTAGGAGGTGGAALEVNLTDVDGLSFDPFTGKLYGSHRREGAPNLEDLLVVINPATGQHVPDAFGPGVDYLVIRSNVAPTSKNDIDDIAVDALTGTMYAIANNGGTADRLVTVNKATGAVTDVGPLGLGDVEGLAFDPFGNLFATTGINGTNGNANAVASINKTTGAGTRLASFAFGTDHEAAACLTDGVNTLTGSVFFDADANGTDGTGADAPAPGATVTLFRLLDGGGRVAVATKTTDAAGAYAFEMAAEGDFVVVVTDPSGGAGAFTTPSENAASVSGFGNAVTLPDVGYATSVDLELDMAVSTPAPAPGETVTFTVTLSNAGAVDATGVSVLNALEDLPGVVTITGVTPSQGTFDGGLWAVGALAAGAAPVTLAITAVITQDNTAITNLAEIAGADQPDVDSTPLDGSTTEDDDAGATASTSGSSSGGEGGLESNGSLAQVLAQVQLDRHIAGPQPAARPYRAADLLARRLGAGTFKGSSASLASLVPTVGPEGSAPVEVSPEDLLPVTNALDIVAVDYLRADGRRLAALFATTTAPGEIYEHTKPVCDRLKGSRLERIETLHIAGHPFVVSELHAGAAVDYAVSFVAYPQADGGWQLDSRFLLRDYVPQHAGDAVNVQVWSPSRAWTAALVEDAIARLGDGVTFLNTDADAPAVPRTYVRQARYRAGTLTVEVVNGGGATAMRLVGGSVASAEGAPRTDLEQTVALPPGAVTTVTVPTGPLFDAAFFVETDGGDGADRLYVADGAWSWAQGDAAVTTFDVAPETGPFAPATRPVERPVTLAGDVTTWAGLVRPLRPGYVPEDVSGFEALAFTAEGEGTVRVLVETAGIATADHWRAQVRLQPDATAHRIAFEDLRRDVDSAERFSGHDVVALSFYVYGDGQTPAPFYVDVRDLRFESGAAAAPETTALLGARPNPFRGRAVVPFALAQAGAVRLDVFDLLGRRIAVLADAEYPAGEHHATFDAAGLSAGVYVARLTAGADAFTTRLTVVR